MLAWNATEDCYRKALEAQQAASCPVPWWFWISGAVAAAAALFEKRKRKRGR